MTGTPRIWPLVLILAIFSTPLVIMYLYQIIDSVASPDPGSLIPGELDLSNWRFLWERIDSGRPTIWQVTFNTFLFASTTAFLVTLLSTTAGYALSRLNMPGRPYFLGGLIILHAFPTITLIIAIFIILQALGLFDTLLGIILVKAALELPFGVWIMKGFYDTVPWEIEMAGVQDGASRFRVWWELVMPQVKPGLAALLIISFLSGWSEFVLPLVLAPGSSTQVLSTFMNAVIQDDATADFGLFKAIGMYYSIPVIVIYLIFQKQLMNIYGGGTKG
ncbi:carbohydrate ABC transporter permease [Ponticoccus sp. SC2-23]|uniref:carbohydrate ABC transporter permease n=1 Tax=Alexandriicola marinus TaxID=2081710 RepID=UPI000FD72394|nr:carbohydrate ABC transporter permease [Alexandriicola marinus]MBM1221444.1 carbohydrate ABC transporter permease [Ponticoccus sp. SC6-9]MBM1226485.1 carbohydrate ABC transporter permease [Ponticoccus sp. SC6-15]MBM1230436.1 carbohydrate ABC transporter permease [Ponticoccus sp. SC6-38]MBM1234959.1 carbohydrate ABC transporter permease [Ponticoccus sp. SC6-45]MBM1239457.1 carbohydrate ABC transporter permease [Ponticoccus sp. SC6-49]MBM1243239.1 carbohydrate ABC transporter permease [Pontic